MTGYELDMSEYGDGEELAKRAHNHPGIRNGVHALAYTPEVSMRGIAREIAAALPDLLNVHEETRVTYLTPGSLYPEDDSRVIDPEHAVNAVDWAAEHAPATAFCFTISTWLVADPVPDGQDGVLRVMPSKVTESGRYYLGGELFTVAQVEAMGDDHRTLVANMRGNRWDTVIRCRTGNWQPFELDDALLPEPVTA